MDLKFIIEQLPYADHLTEDVLVAKGKHKMITSWKEGKQHIKWLRQRLK
jgi:hypothetical protein